LRTDFQGAGPPRQLRSWRPVGPSHAGARDDHTQINSHHHRSDALSTFPDVQLEVHADAPLVDIVARGFDAGIGLKDWAAADLIAA
jgi:hypothetical protein